MTGIAIRADLTASPSAASIADMTALTTEQRIDMATQAHAEGRIIQGAWRRGGGDGGREMVCALAAFGPDINSSDDCPADLMPQWLAELVPSLDDGISRDDVPWFMGELVSRARVWGRLDAAAWERVRVRFQIACIRQAVESATPAQPKPAPAYWVGVQAACAQMIAALESGDAGLIENAAASAAWAAEALAAQAAAYRGLAEKLFGLIDAEISA